MSQNHYDWIQRELNRFYYTLYDALKVLGYTGECKTENHSLICTPCVIHYNNKDDKMIIGLDQNKKYFKCKIGEYDFATIVIVLRMRTNPMRELK